MKRGNLKTYQFGLAALALIGGVHRVVQLWLLWPQLVTAIGVTAQNQVMQLLPKGIMSEHPWWGLWFLQQSPPIPNAIWALALALTQSPHKLAVAFILFQALLSIATAMLMALLLTRIGLHWLAAIALSLIFFLGSDLLLLEYHTMGQFYYELLTMLLAILACHAALSLMHGRHCKAALGLGLCVAGLALTRASFSFLWPMVLLWLLGTGGWRAPKLLIGFLLPVLLLHGGWALKNYYVHGYWSWSTSSWGGANIQQGERNRNGLNFNRWIGQQPAVCASPWHEMTTSPPNYFFLVPTQWDVILPHGVSIPPQIAARDQYIADQRGAPAILDSIAMRLWAQCLQKEFIQYWRYYPEILIRGAWRSYEIFWLPIRQFAVTQPFPIKPEMEVYSEGVHWRHALNDAWKEWRKGYSIRVAPLRLAPLSDTDYSPTKIIALPFFASFISAFNFVLLHSFPLLILLSRSFNRPIGWPKGFSFLLLIYGYLALLSSIVEYGENMRFRIDVEPIIWVICFVTAREWLYFFLPAHWQAKLRILSPAFRGATSKPASTQQNQ